jgi:hypothetical protein
VEDPNRLAQRLDAHPLVVAVLRGVLLGRQQERREAVADDAEGPQQRALRRARAQPRGHRDAGMALRDHPLQDREQRGVDAALGRGREAIRRHDLDAGVPYDRLEAREELLAVGARQQAHIQLGFGAARDHVGLVARLHDGDRHRLALRSWRNFAADGSTRGSVRQARIRSRARIMRLRAESAIGREPWPGRPVVRSVSPNGDFWAVWTAK